MSVKKKCAVLFDGAGLARLGLEQAGFDCVGFELNPIAHYLSGFVGSGKSVLADVKDVDLSEFEYVWASPPCQWISSGRTQGDPQSQFSENLLNWSLQLKAVFPSIKTLWVENVMSMNASENNWGEKFNAAQFTFEPIQNRNRIIGGDYTYPNVFRPYKKAHKGVCPAITATEFRGCKTDKRRASRFYGRKLTIEECAFHQGFEIPHAWLEPQFGLTHAKWKEEIYRAIGNGVPVYMAKAFGEAEN